ncbi:MAG: hypothetical protein Q8P95_03675 [bacterium]|nr:hypothetical protein [bacterium]
MPTTLATQLSFYIANEPGVIGRVCQQMAEHSINIEGIQAAEGQLEQLLRLTPDDPDKAEAALRKMGVELVSREKVLRVPIRRGEGALAEIAKRLGQHGINIDSFFAIEPADGDSNCLVYINASDPEKGFEVLKSGS